MDDVFKVISCAAAAAEVRKVLGPVTLCPNLADMLRSLDRCRGGSCPGHRRLDVIQGALAREARDVETVSLLVLFN